MTLGTHAIVGGSLAVMVPTHPVAAFLLGFASHFLLDSIPHYDYKILSLESGNDYHKIDMKFGKLFLLDLIRISADALSGLLVAFLLFKETLAFPIALFAGAFGAMIPDALQFLYFKFKKEPLATLQRFHSFIQQNRHLAKRPGLGILTQVVTASVFVLAAFLFVIQ